MLNSTGLDYYILIQTVNELKNKNFKSYQYVQWNKI